MQKQQEVWFEIKQADEITLVGKSNEKEKTKKVEDTYIPSEKRQ